MINHYPELLIRNAEYLVSFFHFYRVVYCNDVVMLDASKDGLTWIHPSRMRCDSMGDIFKKDVIFRFIESIAATDIYSQIDGSKSRSPIH